MAGKHTKTMENHHVEWKTHYLDWAIFNSYVRIPDGNHQIDTIRNTTGKHLHTMGIHQVT